MNIGSILGMGFVGGYVDVTKQKDVLAKSQEFKQVKIQNNSIKLDLSGSVTRNSKLNLLDSKTKESLAQINLEAAQNYVNSKGLDVKEKQNSFAVNYSKTTLIGKSEAIDSAVQKYKDLAGTESATFKVMAMDGKEKEVIIKANSLSIDGREFALKGGDSIADALKSNGIKVDGTLNIDVTSVREQLVTKDDGITSTEGGFSLVSYSFKDSTGKIFSGELATADDFYSGDVTSAPDKEVISLDEKYSMSNTVNDVEKENHQFIFLGQVEGFDYSAIYKKQQELKEYLRTVQSVTSGNVANNQYA